mgnify:CR=1 FL=1
MKQTEDFTQDTVTDEMNVAGEPDVTVESAEDVAATEAKAAGETVTAEADAVKDALAEAEKRFVRLQATLIISSDAHCRKKINWQVL